MARLRHSAVGLDITLAPSVEADLTRGISELLAAEGLDGPDGDASIRITVSRGVAPGRGLLPAGPAVATIVIQAWPVAPPPPGHLERGLHLVASAVRRDPANPLAALKTTSRADYVYARLEARRAGADDALFLTIDGRLSEATSANVFLVRGTELATPSLDSAILPGTTRAVDPGLGGRRGPDAGGGFALCRAISPRRTRRSCAPASPASCRSRHSTAPRSGPAGQDRGRPGPAMPARRSSATPTPRRVPPE